MPLSKYPQILDEVSKADFTGLGIDPQAFLEARFPPKLIEELKKAATDPSLIKVVIHREKHDEGDKSLLTTELNAAKKEFSKVASTPLLCGTVPPPKDFIPLDYPLEVLPVQPTVGPLELHLFGLDGDTWVLQTLYLLAQLKVPASVISMLPPVKPLAEKIREQMQAVITPDIQSLTLGTVKHLEPAILAGITESPQYLNRAAEENIKALSSQVDKAISQAEAFDANAAVTQATSKLAGKTALLGELAKLPTPPTAADIAALESGPLAKSAAAPMIKQAKEAQRLDALRAQKAKIEEVKAGAGSMQEKLEALKQENAIKTDPGALSALNKAPAKELINEFYQKEKKDGNPPVTILTIQGQKHALVAIKDAHGDLAYQITKEARAVKPALPVNMLGSCGSLDATNLPVGALVAPTGPMTTLDPLHSSDKVSLTNGMPTSPDRKPSSHGNVVTLLQEHQAGLSNLKSNTVEMESFHVARATNETGPPPPKVVLYVSDVANSSAHGAQASGKAEPDPGQLKDAVVAMGLVDPTK